jgi:cytoskeletal protein CcmA (bactofilin family)
MFSRSRINDQGPKADAPRASEPALPVTARPTQEPRDMAPAYQAPKTKPAASVLSSDLTVTGNLRTTGDIVIEGTIDGDIRAHLLTVGETATIRGEIVADDIVINGRVIGRVRGLKVRLTSTARVEGDIIHKTIAIESGAHFEGSVQRQDDPLGANSTGARQQPAAQQPAPQPARAPAAPPAASGAQAPRAPAETAAKMPS